MANANYLRIQDRFTIENKKAARYSDFLTNFDRNPVTGFLAKATNEESVKQSIKNLLLTDRGERPYQTNIGSKLTSLLFEPFDAVTEQMLRETISETIANYEPRASLIETFLQPDFDTNTYNITIVFSIINIPDQNFTLELVLRRVR